MTVFRAGLRLWPLLAALAIGCDMPGKPNCADRPVPSDQVTDFGTLYRTHCAGCHGADGRLGPGPPLNDPLFLAIVSEKELSRVITEGRAITPGQRSPMPAFARDRGGPLTAAQIGALGTGRAVAARPHGDGSQTRGQGQGSPRVRPRLRRLPRQRGRGRRTGRQTAPEDQRPGVLGADQRSGAAALRHHRPALPS